VSRALGFFEVRATTPAADSVPVGDGPLPRPSRPADRHDPENAMNPIRRSIRRCCRASLLPHVAGATALLLALLPAQGGAVGQPAAGAAAVDPAVGALLAKVAARRGLQSGKPETPIRCDGDYAVTFAGQKEPVAKGTFVDLFAGPERVRHTSNMGPYGAMERGVFDGVVWEVDPSLGPKVHGDLYGAVVRRWFGLLRGDDPRGAYVAFELLPAEAGAAEGAQRLRATPKLGKPDLWHIAADGTVLCIDTALPAPESAEAAFGLEGLVPATLMFAEWRDVEGGRFAMQRTLQMGPATVAFTVTRVTVGAAIDAAAFQPPAAVAKVQPLVSGPALDADGKPIYRVIERQPQPVASIRTKVRVQEISAQLAILLPEVGAYLHAVGGKSVGGPFTRYHGFEGDTVDLEAGIALLEPVAGKGRIQAGELPGGRVVTGWHIGPYEGLAAAHEALAAWLREQNLAARGGVWEIYWTDPGMVPDPKQWKTQLLAPVK
jgi:effector-binding domain-containing protein